MKKPGSYVKYRKDDPYETVSISLPRSLREDVDAQAAKLRLTRTDYTRLLYLENLEKEDGAITLRGASGGNGADQKTKRRSTRKS